MLTAAIEGLLDKVEYELDPIFNVYIPKECPAVPQDIVRPRSTWQNKEAYDHKARELGKLFNENIKKFGNSIPPSIIAAGPRV